MKYMFLLYLSILLQVLQVNAQGGNARTDSIRKTVAVKKGKARKTTVKKPTVLYGTASYYAEKFNGRETANGEIYDSRKMTAACNVLPLGTWIRVTNLMNNRSVVVKTNDHLHIRMKRIVDLSRAAAEKLGYIGRGLTKVRVEVLEDQ